MDQALNTLRDVTDVLSGLWPFIIFGAPLLRPVRNWLSRTFGPIFTGELVEEVKGLRTDYREHIMEFEAHLKDESLHKKRGE